MPFTPVPQVSKKSINRAGETLLDPDASDQEKTAALELAEQWRACHAYPINTFQATLRDKLKPFGGEYIVAQRLKRMPTIIDKLKRNPNVPLSVMQDIGGVRAVLKSVDDVYKLVDLYVNKSRFEHVLNKENNYIAEPRNEDGYRSHHLIYQYKNSRYPNYDGLKLELQIRTKLQHAWATAVETMDIFLRDRLKYQAGNIEWQRFFTLISAAFALQEKCPMIPVFKDMSDKDIYAEIAKSEKSLDALNKMTGYTAVVNHIFKQKGSKNSSYYHIILLDLTKKEIAYIPYSRDSFSEASEALSRFEKEQSEGKKIETVLVSAGPVESLRKAYPNFFLDISVFVAKVRLIVRQARSN